MKSLGTDLARYKAGGGLISGTPGYAPPPALNRAGLRRSDASFDSGNAEAPIFLQRAKVAMIAAHAELPTRQADLEGISVDVMSAWEESW